MERDLRVHILLGESRAVNGEPEESAGAGGKHLGKSGGRCGAALPPRHVVRATAVREAAVRIPLTISEYRSHRAVSARRCARPADVTL
jgi:hypothetical protein